MNTYINQHVIGSFSNGDNTLKRTKDTMMSKYIDDFNEYTNYDVVEVVVEKKGGRRMIYTIILKDRSAFMTDWYSYENCWSDKVFCVIDNARDKITFDGVEWEIIERDHL